MNDQYEYPEWEEILKRFALWGGIGLAFVSMYFSWDGLDQIPGGNPNYSEIAQIIGIVMAIATTLIQFIFNTDIRKQSSTLILIGVVSYVYSLITNYMGIEHLFGFKGVLGGLISVFMDVAPEAMIAWSLNDAVSGDMVGNIIKSITGVRPRKSSKPNHEPARNFPYTQNQPSHPSKKEQARMRYEQGRGDTKPSHPFEKFGGDR